MDKERIDYNQSASQTETKKKRNKSPSPKKHRKVNKEIPADHKTLICEITRLKGQEKLLYIKQANQKKYSDKVLFENYPHCKLQSFVFPAHQLRESYEIIRDQNGLHWIEQLSSHNHSSGAQGDAEQKMNGWGISIYNDGKIFEGVYHDSRPCGTGYELQPNGNTYVGGFKEGSKSGKGSFYWFTSGQMYTGDWLGGLPHGEGKYLSQDFYEGQFCNGMKYGNGQQIFQNGDRYLGEYINGVADGYGQYYWSDGSVYKGDFKHGVRHGYGIWNDKDETEIFSGCYRIDKKEGYGVYEWVGKQVYKGQFKDDFREGFGKLLQYSPKLVGDSSEDQGVEEKEVYRGMWLRGKQRSDLPVDKEAERGLDSFVRENKLKVQKKKRVGHQHCIPKS